MEREEPTASQPGRTPRHGSSVGRGRHGVRAPASRLARLLLRLVVVVVLVWLVRMLVQWSGIQMAALQAGARFHGTMLAVLVLAYAALIAIPFVPGVELGLALMLVDGAKIVPVVYAATVFGLLSAYLAGSWLPEHRLRNLLTDLRMRRAAELIAGIAAMSHEARLAALRARLPGRVPRSVLRHRYVVLALLVNLPGNSVLGGGGGILLFAGFTGLFGIAGTVLTILIAVLPVPAIIWLSPI